MLTLTTGFICGLIGLLLAGWIGDQWTTWFHTSSREGAAGFAVMFAAVSGGVAGAIVGMVCGWRAPGFLQGLAAGLSLLLVSAALAWGYGRTAGDIAPTWDDDLLRVVVEVRTPAGWQGPAEWASKGVWLSLARVDDGKTGHSTSESIQWGSARQEHGRWIIGADVWLFTSRGQRQLTLRSGYDTLTTFTLPLPAQPGREFTAWSAWSEENAAGYAFRFQVRKTVDLMAGRQAQHDAFAAECLRRMNALKADAPLERWLELIDREIFSTYDADAQVRILNVIRSRAQELAALLESDDQDAAGAALHAIYYLYEVPPSLEGPLLKRLAVIHAAVRDYAAQHDERQPDLAAASALKSLFFTWASAWEQTGKPAPPAVREIGEIAATVPRGTEMSGLAGMTDHYLEQWPAPAQ